MFRLNEQGLLPTDLAMRKRCNWRHWCAMEHIGHLANWFSSVYVRFAVCHCAYYFIGVANATLCTHSCSFDRFSVMSHEPQRDFDLIKRL